MNLKLTTFYEILQCLLYMICVYKLMLLVILNQNKFLFSISSLLWWCGRGHLSLTWDQPIANHKHPNIQSPPHRHNQAPPTSVIVHIRHNRGEKTSTTSL